MKAIEQPPQLARTKNHPRQPEIWRDELNLAEWPLGYLSDRPIKGTITRSDLIFVNGKPHQRSITVTGTTFGLLTPRDDYVLLGAIELTRRKNGFTSSTVAFTLYEYLELLGWSDSGQSYLNLRDSISRLWDAGVVFNQSWWNNDREEWERRKAFRILQDIDLKKTDDPDVLSSFTWSRVVFNSFRAGHLKALDWNLYTRLSLPGSRRAYRFLSKRFYRKSELDMDLREYGQAKIGLSECYNTAQLKRKLEPFHRDLEAHEFLQPMPQERRYRKIAPGQWRVHLIKARPAKPKPESLPPGSPLVAELSKRNVTETVAQDLVAAYPESRVILQIEVHDWLRERGDKRIGRNPAGWLVQAIKQGYEPPNGFETKAQREERDRRAQEHAHAQKQAEEDRRRQEAEAREQALAPIRAYLAARNPEEVERLQEEAIAQADDFHRRQAQKPDSDLVNAVREKLLHEHVARLLAQTAAPSTQPVTPAQ